MFAADSDFFVPRPFDFGYGMTTYSLFPFFDRMHDLIKVIRSQLCLECSNAVAVALHVDEAVINQDYRELDNGLLPLYTSGQPRGSF